MSAVQGSTLSPQYLPAPSGITRNIIIPLKIPPKSTASESNKRLQAFLVQKFQEEQSKTITETRNPSISLPNAKKRPQAIFSFLYAAYASDLWDNIS
ncbi:MAG: hypothetical protein Q4E67_03745 [Planctomycetia bacterium]|nr:hypothetical protein [Planctomycetia bacterium]